MGDCADTGGQACAHETQTQHAHDIHLTPSTSIHLKKISVLHATGCLYIDTERCSVHDTHQLSEQGPTLRKSMCCILPDFCALMEYSAMYIRGLAATGGRAGMPAHVSKCSSTKSTPHTSRLVLRTGPPPIRQFTSISRGPLLVYLSSTWKTPCSAKAGGL